MKARDVMRLDVISVRDDATLLEAAELMLRNKISGLPAVDASGHLVGVVTERDFLRQPGAAALKERPRWSQVLLRPTPSADEELRFRDRTVREVMTANAITVSESTPLEEVVRLMEEHQIKRVPVVRNGRVVGLIARADLVRAIVPLVRRSSLAVKDDAAVTARLTDLEKRVWAHRTKQPT
jgi:CBS domain-containing protein